MSALLIGEAGIDLAGWLALFVHFLMLSLLAVGGAMTTAPDMQRFVVEERGWLSDPQFAASVALGQAAPGPNVIFVAVLGYNVAGLAGVVATLAGTLLPSSLLTLRATRWAASHRQAPALLAFTAGLAPITLGLLLATAIVLLLPAANDWRNVLLAMLAFGVALRTHWSPLVPIAAGAVAGAMGWVG